MIVDAAVITEQGKIYTGSRHPIAMQKAINDGVERITQDMQGFVDHNGVYYSRRAAAVHAYDCGQTKEILSPLTSEDLW